ncbi:hypothetical protein [Botrimarina sp.]|uniref:pectate lyase family protein n=1 Tax=Botrimarina sp. TaxID=2795802 RepID=UPI0032ECCF1D
MRFALFFTVTCVACLVSAAADAAPRFDLSAATGRSDAETRGWTEWEFGGASAASRDAEGLTITLRAEEGLLEGFLHKAGLATGATLASDGFRSEGPIEIKIEGLSAGRHSLATWHAAFGNGPAGEVTLAVGDATDSARPARAPKHDADAATAYVEFDADADKPVRVRLSAADGPVVLNALELDAPNPARRAESPTPADYDGHADGDNGSVKLSWQGGDNASEYRVFLGSASEEGAARAIAAAAREPLAVTTEPTADAPIEENDSLRWYAWRVDTLGSDGRITPGQVWAFRVRHLAFPGAQGYGRFARGGRGGRVLHVTNLNDSGPGSLRAAVEAEGPRTVVFDVSGRIVLQSRLIIRNGELTIAGQTAPGMGVCLSNYNLGAMGAEDVIIRYLRVRPGDTAGKTLDGMGLASCNHAIVDHCSISWTQDESFSSRGAENITLQRTLISEALNIAGHKKYEDGKSHGFAASIGGDIGSFHHNLLAHCAGRNWSLAGGVDQANRHRGRLDIRNNVVYNWDHRTTDGGARLVQFVNNYYKPGPATRILTYLNPDYENPSFGPQQYYVEGNVVEGVSEPEGPVGPFAGMDVRGSQPEPVTLDEPFFPPHVDTQPARKAYDDVLADVGCNYPELDEHDQRVLREVREGTTTYTGSRSGKPGLPDSQDDVGGWEDYPEVQRDADWDPDADGIPSEWERSHGLDPNDPTDGPVDPDRDGYTNLEDYLNGLVE